MPKTKQPKPPKDYMYLVDYVCRQDLTDAEEEGCVIVLAELYGKDRESVRTSIMVKKMQIDFLRLSEPKEITYNDGSSKVFRMKRGESNTCLECGGSDVACTYCNGLGVIPV